MTLWTQLRSAKLRVENERLTIDNRRLTEMWDTDREALTAEIEQLRIGIGEHQATIRGLEGLLRHQAGQLDEALREIDRLLVDNAELSAECDQWQKKLADTWAELAELRAREPNG